MWYEAAWIQWAGVATGALCVWLFVRQNIWTWPVSIANNVFFIIVMVPAKLYADAGLQVVYIAMELYGWWHWLYGNPAARDALPVRRTPRGEAVVVGAVAAAVFVAIGLLLRTVTDSDVPWFDAFPTTASLAAQHLLNRKYLGTWWTWILLVNVPYLGLYLAKGLWPLAGFQVVLAALSVQGWWTWRRAVEPGPSPLLVPAVAPA